MQVIQQNQQWLYLYGDPKGMYGLLQSGILANKLLKNRLAKDGYFELPHTPNVRKHITCPIQFMLVVDAFDIKYVEKEHLDHLINAIEKYYQVTLDENSSLYCGIRLEWDYNK